MRILQSSAFRAVCAIVTGILLINNPDNTMKGITIAIGILFLLSGVISCAAYLNARKQTARHAAENLDQDFEQPQSPTFPIVGVGSALLGLILALMPETFITSLMYILGALLVLGAIGQFMTLAGVMKTVRVPVLFWIGPSLILLTGLFVILKPMQSASMPLLIIGWCLLFYGVTECVNALKIYKSNKKRLNGNGYM